MNERFILVKTAMREAYRGGVSCDSCDEPISGPKVTVVKTTVPRGSEVPNVEVIFMHMNCAGGGDNNGTFF